MRKNIGLYRGKVLFNGKHYFAGDWVYGFYSEDVTGNAFIKDNTEDEYGNTFLDVDVQVNPETVGEFIDWTDKKRNNIYEGDKIQMYHHDIIEGFHVKSKRMNFKPSGKEDVDYSMDGDTNDIRIVQWHMGSIMLCAFDGSSTIYKSIADLSRPGNSIEIVGTIHDKENTADEC